MSKYRGECPLCVTWVCDLCEWAKYYVVKGEFVRCGNCGSSIGTTQTVRHTGALADQHLAEYQSRGTKEAPVVELTESDVDAIYQAAHDENIDGRVALREELFAQGFVIVADSKPTDAARLAELIDGHINPDGITPESLAEYLVLHGVKAPEAGGDDE